MCLCHEQNGLCRVAVIIFKYVNFNFVFFPACGFYTTHSEMPHLFIFLKTPADVPHTTVFTPFLQLKDIMEKCCGNRAFSLNVVIMTSLCHDNTGEALFLFSHRS